MAVLYASSGRPNYAADLPTTTDFLGVPTATGTHAESRMENGDVEKRAGGEDRRAHRAF